jgi:hypothetical protein
VDARLRPVVLDSGRLRRVCEEYLVELWGMEGASELRLREAYGAAGWSLQAVFFLAVRRRGFNVAGRPAFGF